MQRGRVGVVGHSNGGYTALAIAGALPTPLALMDHCGRHAADDPKFCSFGGAATREATARGGAIPDVRDPRVRAIVLLAPNALPFTDEGLGKVAVPVRLYAAERDDLTLVRYHAERLARALPRDREYVVIDLMEALKASLAKKGLPAEAATAKKPPSKAAQGAVAKVAAKAVPKRASGGRK